MNRARKLALTIGACLVLTALGAIPALAASGFFTSVKPYATPVTNDYEIKPLISSGDTVPETSDPSKRYQFVGIPDGVGIAKLHGKQNVFVNHELRRTQQTETVLGEPLNRGAVVSKLVMGRDGSIVSGERAYDKVFNENTYVGPAADTTNTTPAFARFCSAFMADWKVGFSEPVYLAGEESGGTDTFDGKGGLSVAIYRNEAHALPKLGRFPWENQVVVPYTGRKTVVMGLEDGPSTPDSQLYMYVGTKVPGASSVLRRNGLDNGKLYVYVDDTHTDEGDFQNGATAGTWVEIPNAENLTDVQLEAEADAKGAFGFVRSEDGAANPLVPGQFNFVTTGSSYPAVGSEYNKLGRIYGLQLNVLNPTGAAKLKVLVNADDVIAGGGDTAISPDNVGMNGRYLMVQEDGTGESRPVMASKNRDGSIWRYDTWNNFKAERVAELDPAGADGIAVGPGVWETSGIIDTNVEFGPNTWLFDVQAHAPTTAPGSNTVEDGQLLQMVPKN
ncbi:MAG: DUF839 domain-containing protein [Thermoleophilaceae bacterium]|nr:DUF839 domain-containing protein [Thermoleophilaceae bacterium]